MIEKNKLQDEDLELVNGGADIEIDVEIKTLEGENDPYSIHLSTSDKGGRMHITKSAGREMSERMIIL